MRIRSLGSPFLIIVGMLISTPEIARAQAPAFGYAFVSPVITSNIGDRWLAWNVGTGAEMWVWSRTASHHFSGSEGDIGMRPFVTGGFSFLLTGEQLRFFNIGGGVDRWVAPHAGLRFEVRDQFFVTPGGAGSLLLGFRVGVILR
jgi:hypothetical protein